MSDASALTHADRLSPGVRLSIHNIFLEIWFETGKLYLLREHLAKSFEIERCQLIILWVVTNSRSLAIACLSTKV
jgi:hypothetical protein